MTLNSDRHVMKSQCLGDDQGGTLHSRHFGFNYSRGTGILRALLCVAVEWDCLPFHSSSRAQSPTFLAAGAKKTILEDSFSIDPGWGRGGRCFGMIQAHYIYHALYFYYFPLAPPQIIRHWSPEIGDPCSSIFSAFTRGC